ncbi:hypothetical protein SAMN05216404_104149 [Nitrosospira multiformis]|uniref:Uncharacterized protein n=1 Tax=Nitrosospira multiformis TaxID=1231 RepID=A0A1H8GBW3_9PROT|nr:hypothetical protein SAMN05216404_104149 [Nitrosospira multiformis]
MWHIAACDKLSHVILRHSRQVWRGRFHRLDGLFPVYIGFAESALLLTVLNIAVRYPLIYHVHNAGGRFASGNEISSEKI